MRHNEGVQVEGNDVVNYVLKRKGGVPTAQSDRVMLRGVARRYQRGGLPRLVGLVFVCCCWGGWFIDPAMVLTSFIVRKVGEGR